MKILYLECNMGVAGDMLMGALLDIVEDKDSFIRQMQQCMNLPEVRLSYQKDKKCGICGTHIKVSVHGTEEESRDVLHTLPPHAADGHHHEHHDGHHHDGHYHDGHHDEHYNEHQNECHDIHHAEHHHTHHQGHVHISLAEIEQLVGAMALSENVKNNVMAVYGLIAEAESKAHGMPVEQIHFHEVGTLDALADIVGCCLLMEQIAPDKVVVSPVKTGFGQVRCAHGILPVPAPATAFILKGVPTLSGDIEGELCTPTGAALIKHFADGFSHQPEMSVAAIGYGTGTKDFPVANCVRAVVGKARQITEPSAENSQDSVIELSCNIDDMTGEELGYAKERLVSGKALDVYTIAIGMKKNRPGTMLSVLCKPEDRDEVIQDIFRYTTTLGIRMYQCPRFVLERTEEERCTEFGKIRVKISQGYGVKREKAEHEDLRKIVERKDETNL